MKVLGIGNALIDILAKLENENLLNDMQLPKGSMNLIDVKTRNLLFDKFKEIDIKVTTGGSAGNTCLALGELNTQVGFIGKVGDDDYGNFFVKEYTEAGINPHFIHAPNPSGTAMVMITPDGERTFGTYLGVAAEMNKQELLEEVFKQYDCIYIEGYLVQNHELIEGALKLAKSLNKKTSLDLASFNVVEAEREFLSHLIKEYVDIVFANETEAKALTGEEPIEAIKKIAEDVEIAVVKTGEGGSLVMHKGELIHIPVEKIIPIDTTAAGDYYAAGFFYGLEKDKSLKQCAEYGSILAGEIIQVVGTKLSSDTWNQIKQKLS